MIFSHVLYQLSYLGICAREGPPKGRAGVIEARFWAVQNGEKPSIRGLWAGTGKPIMALICAVEGAVFPFLGHFALAPVRDAMDLKRLFPMQDLPSARLMKLKAFCLFRAGVLTEQEMNEIREKADAFARNPRFASALHPRRAA